MVGSVPSSANVGAWVGSTVDEVLRVTPSVYSRDGRPIALIGTMNAKCSHEAIDALAEREC